MPDRAALEIALERLEDFGSPVEELEQYRTPGDVAAHVLWDAYLRGDVSDRVVVDLGCGTGVLAYGSLLLGAAGAVCLDIDWKALEVARENLGKFRGMFDLIAGDVGRSPLRPLGGDCVVIMNPPFGVKRRGADAVFLREALKLCPRVYSIHKYAPRSLDVLTRIAGECGYSATVISMATMSLRQRLRHHRRRVYRFEVLLIRFAKNQV